jgi:hypothetical protein
MEVTRDRSAKRLKLTQKRAISDLLEEFGMESARPRRVPMSPGEKVQKEGELLNTEECRGTQSWWGACSISQTAPDRISHSLWGYSRDT